MSRHLDADLLAEFRAGLVRGRRAGGVAAHLASCAACAALDEQVAAVSALLAAVPAPVLPDHVAARLDAALALAQAQRAVLPAEDVVSPGRRPARRWPSVRWGALWRGRVLAPAAAALVLAGGVAFGLAQLTGSSSSSSTASSAAGAAARPSAFGLGNNGASGSAANNAALTPAAAPAPYLGTFRMVPATLDLQPDTLRQQLITQLDERARLRTVAPSQRLRGCVSAVTGGKPPVLVELARYRDAPATVIVVRVGAGYRAWVVGSGCAAGRPDVLQIIALP